MSGTKQFKILIPEDLHRQFKSKCALQGVDMTEVLLRFIADFVGEKERQEDATERQKKMSPDSRVRTS
jgi:hypothetical protein